MPTRFYTGEHHLSQPNEATAPLSVRRSRTEEARFYRPAKGVVEAVNVALLLNRPLLVTGEPGTGKTQLAYSIALEFGLGEPLVFETKSRSDSRELFYTYDSLNRFLARGEDSLPPRAYITFNALGTAILKSNYRNVVEHFLPADFEHYGPQQSVVLIDEIDKAPRDFPNDLLNEIENQYFKIPELRNVSISASRDPDLAPIVIITSNSEKHLPDAFLRRCTYYDIPFPSLDELEEIIWAHIAAANDGERSRELIKSALEFFARLRRASLDKPVATAELLDWVHVLLKQGANIDESVRRQPDLARGSLSALIKSREDRPRAITILDEWLNTPKTEV